MNNMDTSPVLQIRHLSKHFSGVYALKGVHMDIYPGEVTAIIGENGAGKSTLMKLISGVYQHFEGEIMYQGEKIAFRTPKEAAMKGIQIIHQELNLLPHLNITENLFLGNEITTPLGILDYRKMHQRASELLQRLHLDIPPETEVGMLRVGQQQLVEIAKALLFDSKVLIMDEPTSAISDQEVSLLFRIINEMKMRGVAVVYISHKLNELFEIADRYAVLKDGESMGSGFMRDTNRDKLIQLMVGRESVQHIQKTFCIRDEAILKVENLSLRHSGMRDKMLVKDLSFSLRKGEILGICGLMGAGRTEILEAIFGMHPKSVSGKIWVEGKVCRIRSIKDAIDAGIALVPEDRKLQGLIMNMNVVKNTSLASLDFLSKFNFISRIRELELSNSFVKKLQTKTGPEQLEVDKLSGGNQQKVVIAKWLATNPKILMLDEPTRGIDVGAKSEIYKLMFELASRGLGILFVSSEMVEILAVSDNIMVMSESRQTAFFSREEATEEKIMKASLPAGK